MTTTPKAKTTKLSKRAILDRLATIAQMGEHGSPFICADQLFQEDLFAIQQEVATLMTDLANEVRGGPEKLARLMPHTFKTTLVFAGDETPTTTDATLPPWRLRARAAARERRGLRGAAMMTWREMKAWVEDAGVTDDTVIFSLGDCATAGIGRIEVVTRPDDSVELNGWDPACECPSRIHCGSGRAHPACQVCDECGSGTPADCIGDGSNP